MSADEPTIVPGRPGGTRERPAVFFADADEFERWLDLHHQAADELWMGLYRKGDPDQGLTWDEAVPVALCFGWIDSVSQKVDDRSRRQRWTPRRKDSNWSLVNIAHVERLLAQERMRPAGLAAYEQRTTRGYSYEVEAAELDQSTRAVLDAAPVAARFFELAQPSYRRKCLNWVMGAKQPATRIRRATQLRDASSRGELVGPFAYETPPRWAAQAYAQASAEVSDPD